MTALQVKAQARRGAFSLDVDFAALLDGVTAVFGPSGAGKSLLLSLIAGVQRLDAGRIAFGEEVLAEPGAHMPAHRRGIGLTFQDAHLFPHLSVRDNLRYAARRAPRDRARPKLKEAATLFDAAHLLDRYPRHLSGGERSRVALARALLAAPRLLLLDEPFAALDATRRHTFLQRLGDAHARFGLPMLFVTHQVDDAVALASALVALRDGRIVAQGPLQSAARMPAFQGLLERRDAGAALPASFLNAAGPAAGQFVWVRADAVLIAVQNPVGLSARNVFAARVKALAEEPSGAKLVTLESAGGDVLARITASAVQDLNIRPDMRVWAIVKAHAL
ncbi:MAG: ATP-binding cassette domain-containing protein [Alphaproteobacteria bacterium]|nr:ATP-binding cassette domain-containing protein [Alphaproteobacteria bacterium]